MNTLQDMREHEIIHRAAEFLCDSFKLKSNTDIPTFKSKEEQDIWIGSFAGFVEGMAVLIKQEDDQLYYKLIDALERVSLR